MSFVVVNPRDVLEQGSLGLPLPADLADRRTDGQQVSCLDPTGLLPRVAQLLGYSGKDYCHCLSLLCRLR